MLRRQRKRNAEFQVYAEFQTPNSIAHVASRIGEHLAAMLGNRVSMYCKSGRPCPHLPARQQGLSDTAPVGIFIGFPRDSVRLLRRHQKVVGVYVCEADRIPKHWVELCNAHAAIVVPSNYCRAAFVESGVKVPVHVVPHGVDEPAPLCGQPPLPGIPLLHVFNANPMFNRKGVTELLQAFAVIRQRHVGLNLVLKTNESPWTAAWRQEGVQVITARYSRDDVSRLYQRVAGLVFPSRGEGFGMPPLEALSHGLPVVVPNHTGLADFVSPERDCIIEGPYKPVTIETWDNPRGKLLDITVDQIVDGMEDFLANRDEYTAKARAFDWTPWSWSAALKGLPDILDGVLRQPRRDPVTVFNIPPLPSNPHPRKRHTEPVPGARATRKDHARTLSLWMGDKQRSAFEKDPTGLGVVVSELAKRIPVTSGSTSVLLVPFNPEHCRFSQFDVPVVAYTTFESDRWPSRWVAELNHCLKVIVPQEWVAASLRLSGCRVPVEVVPQAFKRMPKVKPRHRAGGDLVVGFLGVPVQRKNLKMLVESLPEGVRVLVRAAWLPKTADVPKGSNIDYLGGNLSDEDLHEKFWSQIDVLVMPSSGEGYSMVPREAIAMGIPTIISDIPAHEDITCPKIRKAGDLGAFYEFIPGTCGTWAKPDRAHLRELLEGARDDTLDFSTQEVPDHTWDKTVAAVRDVCDYRFTTYVPPQDRGGGIDRFAKHLQESWPGLKYVIADEDLDHFAPAIEWLVVQFEYGLYSRSLLQGLKDLKERCGLKLAFIMHSVNGHSPEVRLNADVAAMADRVILLNPGQGQFMDGVYLEHPWPTPVPYNEAGDTNVVGIHGYIHRQKGYRHVFGVARASGRDVLLAGRIDFRHDANRACYHEQIAANQKPGDELHLRYVPDGELEALMGRAGCLMYPYEPWRNYQASGAVRNAIRFGRPILVSEHEQYFDVPANIFPKLRLDDTPGMVAAVETVMEDPQGWYERQADHARTHGWNWFVRKVKDSLQGDEA